MKQSELLHWGILGFCQPEALMRMPQSRHKPVIRDFDSRLEWVSAYSILARAVLKLKHKI